MRTRAAPREPSSALANIALPHHRSGHDPSRLFHRSVNKRNVPDYYDIIKEPMALSILKQKINKREYKNFAEFVRDCALVSETAAPVQPPRAYTAADWSDPPRYPTMRRRTTVPSRRRTKMRWSSRWVDRRKPLRLTRSDSPLFYHAGCLYFRVQETSGARDHLR